MKWVIECFQYLTCKHKPKEMNLMDYGLLKDAYFLTICDDCGKILHGVWMGSKERLK